MLHGTSQPYQDHQNDSNRIQRFPTLQMASSQLLGVPYDLKTETSTLNYAWM